MKLMLTATDISPEFTFNEAAPIWLEARAKIAPRTRKDYRRYLKSCLPFFGKFRLNELHIGIISKYQKERNSTAGAIVINKEVGTILQIRRRANIKDDELEKFYEPLPIPYWTPPRSISNTEESKLLSALQSKSAWEMIYYYAVLALKTGASGCELRGLRLGDINWDTLRMTIHNNCSQKQIQRTHGSADRRCSCGHETVKRNRLREGKFRSASLSIPVPGKQGELRSRQANDSFGNQEAVVRSAKASWRFGIPAARYQAPGKHETLRIRRRRHDGNVDHGASIESDVRALQLDPPEAQRRGHASCARWKSRRSIRLVNELDT
jgi:integrase